MRCVPAEDFNLSKAMAWRSAIADDPPYQRQGSIWSLEKQQLFIDSLLNGYDVPKIYLHDLRGTHPTRVYAVVDGKQRLTAIWRFMRNEFPLAADFRIEPANLPELPAGTSHPAAGDRFADLDPAWQRVLRTTHLAVVLIQRATEEDIDELFSRLNNGEPLNAAERRNALGGTMARLVRRIARHEFFARRVRFSNRRYQHLDAATRLLALEVAASAGPRLPTGRPQVPVLHSRGLDTFLRQQRSSPATRLRELARRVETQLDRMSAVFGHADPLLGAPSSVPLCYLLVRSFSGEVSGETAAALRAFLQRFDAERRGQIRLPDHEQDPPFREFNRLLRAGPNSPENLARRLELLVARLHREESGLARRMAAATDGTLGRAMIAEDGR